MKNDLTHSAGAWDWPVAVCAAIYSYHTEKLLHAVVLRHFIAELVQFCSVCCCVLLNAN